jgi:hypothetical protein
VTAAAVNSDVLNNDLPAVKEHDEEVSSPSPGECTSFHATVTQMSVAENMNRDKQEKNNKSLRKADDRKVKVTKIPRSASGSWEVLILLISED